MLVCICFFGFPVPAGFACRALDLGGSRSGLSLLRALRQEFWVQNSRFWGGMVWARIRDAASKAKDIIWFGVGGPG